MIDAHTTTAGGLRTFTFLGTGTSVGVPMIGCDCAVCRSTNPRNNRYRCSVLIRAPRGQILIDTTPELRLQLLRADVKLVHAVIYTHYHADHLFGLDDLRLFPAMLNGPMPIYCNDEVEEVIRQAFAYAFHPGGEDLPAGMLPKLEFCRIDERPFDVLGERFTPIPLIHGRFNVFGFRIGDVAYCTDVSAIPDRSWPLLGRARRLCHRCAAAAKAASIPFQRRRGSGGNRAGEAETGLPHAHVAHDGLRPLGRRRSRPAWPRHTMA